MKHNLLKSVILSVILLMGVTNAWAGASWIGNSYIVVNGTWYNGSATNQSSNFDKTNLGSITSLSLGGEIQTYGQNDGAKNPARMHYQIQGQTATYITLYWFKYADNNNYFHSNSNGSTTTNNAFAAKTIDISALAPGTYTLSVWFEQPDGGQWDSNNRNNYVASFTIDPVVTFKANGGTGSDKTQRVTYNTNTTLTANTFTRTGYSFTGWNTKADGTGTGYSDKETVKFTANQTLYAQWTNQYTITLAPNGGSGNNQYVTATYNSNVLIGTITKPTRTGYDFIGWGMQKENKDRIVIDIEGYLQANKSDATLGEYTGEGGIWKRAEATTLYANWLAKQQTITLDKQGGEGGTNSIDVTYNEAMPNIEIPRRNGYEFAGYFVDASGTKKQYYDKDGKPLDKWKTPGNTTLYAKWTATNYTITYNTNGGNSIAQKTYTIETATFALPTPTRTGYTFAGWYDNANLTGNKVTQVAKGSTGNKTFYAAWTIDQYTLTYSAGEGGTVSGSHTSGTQIDYNTSVTLTATPAEGNALNQWVDENGNLVSYDNPYTFKITKNTTLKAEFTPSTTVYLKPEDYWKSDNACFAIVASATGKSNRTIDMENVDCNNEYYSANIPTGYTTFKYVRINPANKNQVWNETGKLDVQNAMGKMYVTPRIYLKPDNNWKSDNARFAVYFWKSSNTSENTWRSLTHIGNDIYTCQTPGESYDRAIFCRMNPNTVDNNFNDEVTWNKTNDLFIDHNSIAGKNLYTVTKATGNFMTGEIGEWHTHWETFAPTYTVTLEKTTYGKYAVELNGQKYYSSQSEDVVINNVPVKSTLRLVSSESFNAAYNNNMCIQTHDGVDFEELNAEHRICGNTIIKENFTTLAAHTVYLRVPTSLGSWNTSGANYIYSHNNTANYVVVEASTPTDEEIYKESGYNYFKFVIPAGCRTFRFERKTAQDVAATNVTEDFTRYLPFEMTNCYTIEGIYSGNIYYGSWGMSLANGDYRLLYVEQVVEKYNVGGNEWKTVVTRKKAHPSNIIKKGTASQIVSLHVYKERKYTANAGGGKTYESSSNPEIILQQYSNGGWVDKERHMVLGPLQTLPGMAMAPGRRNTASATATLVYDDGIEVIKDDNEDGRVWNFTVTQDVNDVATLPLDGENLVPYEGQYYIRTDNAEGGWMDYTIPDNHMHFSQYAKDNSNFSHYFCKWVETDKKDNTKFVIANDYGVAISDTLSEDQFTDQYGNIQENANIRWSWNETTNEIARAYIQGAYDGKAQNENILLDYTTDGTTDATDVILFDTGDWIYSIDVTVKVGSTLKSITATYPKITHTIDSKTINPTTQIFEQELPMLTGGENENLYTVRVLYDFKIDKTLVALVPNENQAEIAIDVMIERTNQGPATQVKADITYTNNQRSGEGSTVYAVMSFTKAHLTDANKSEQEKLTYWISFPFDVTISDVFGFGEVGQYWMIKYYDGAERADIGWFLDTKTFWKYKTKKSDVLKANTGYVLTLNKKVMDPNSPIFTNTEKVSLYFPSTAKITTIDPDVYTVTEVEVPTHKCTITSPADRTNEDSNWNLIGVPSYANKDNVTTNTTVKYFYDYNYKDDTYAVAQNGGTKTFQSMFAYMVQFGGIIDWKSFDFKEGAQGLAAKRNTDSDAEQHNLRLELQQDGNKADHTFIQLQDEDATEMFDMNSDLCKIINAGSNIYSIITAENTPVNVAGNVLPIQETVIPLGVVISAAGEYTFAMPDGTDGIVVELIDYETNITTNLLLDNYTVNLGKGTFDNRFALHVQPSKVTTSVEDINTNSNGVKKYLIDGILYMQKDGVLYDAQGKLVR